MGPGAAGGDGLCEGVAALVLKPAVLGGFERTAELAAWACQRGMLAVVSSAFESSLGTAQLAQLAAALDASSGAGSSSSSSSSGSGSATQHGLATLSWFAEDLLPAAAGAGQLLQPQDPVSSSSSSSSSSLDGSVPGMAISTAAAQAVVEGGVTLALTLGLAVQRQRQLRRRRCAVQTASGSYDFSLLEAQPGSTTSSRDGSSRNGSGSAVQPPLLFLHGFLGEAPDWSPLVQALGLERRCLAIDLPGHGGTAITSNGRRASNGNGTGSRRPAVNGAATAAAAAVGAAPQAPYSLEAAAEAVAALVQAEGLAGCQLVGYSLGARLALLLAARWPHLFSGVVSVSGGWVGGTEWLGPSHGA